MPTLNPPPVVDDPYDAFVQLFEDKGLIFDPDANTGYWTMPLTFTEEPPIVDMPYALLDSTGGNHGVRTKYGKYPETDMQMTFYAKSFKWLRVAVHATIAALEEQEPAMSYGRTLDIRFGEPKFSKEGMAYKAVVDVAYFAAVARNDQ